MASVGPRKSGNKVHPNFIPLPFGNLQRLKQSSGPLVFSFDSLTDITSGYVGANFSLHPMPPKLLSKILVHFGSAGVD